MDKTKKESDNLERVSIRLSPEILAIVNIFVANCGKTCSEILRLLIDKRLLDYVPRFIFVEHKDAAIYHKNQEAILSEMEAIRSELNRIGVNYNQEIKLKHIKTKYDGLGNSLDIIMAKQAEEDEVKKDSLPAEYLDALMSRYEEATKKVGELLCHIHE